VPYSQVQCDQPVRDLFDTKRKLWKLEHDITTYKIPVELYVEDRDQPVVGSSYSLLTNTWIRKPKKIQAHWDNAEISRETLTWMDRIRDTISSGDLRKIHELKLELKDYRKQGLAQQGEFGSANLTFKNLRNLGAIEMLVKASIILHDRKLSI
jgi:hypothetical protein